MQLRNLIWGNLMGTNHIFEIGLTSLTPSLPITAKKSLTVARLLEISSITNLIET